MKSATGKKKKKSKAMGGMLMGVRKGITGNRGEGGRNRKDNNNKDKNKKGEVEDHRGLCQWRFEEEVIRDWMKEKRKGMRTIIGRDFNARTREMDGWWERRDKRGKKKGQNMRKKKERKSK